MDYVRKALVHRFWILSGIALLLPIIGWATVKGSLQAETRNRTGQLKTVFKNIEDLGKGPQPNETWKTEVDKLTSNLETRVNAAWEELYAKQEPELTWPADVKAAMDEVGPDQLQVRQIYRSQYQQERTKTAQLAEPAVLPFQQLRFEDWGDQPPTAEQMRNAQEDIWVERAVLKVIQKTNQPAETVEMAPIKSIDNLAIGKDVHDPPSVVIKGTGTQAPRTATRSGLQGSERYVRTSDQYNLMRFQIALTMDHRRIPDLLANLGSSPVPIEVTNIAMYREGSGAGGEAARVATDSSLATVEIYGNIFLLKPPPSRQGQTQVAGAKPRGAGQ